MCFINCWHRRFHIPHTIWQNCYFSNILPLFYYCQYHHYHPRSTSAVIFYLNTCLIWIQLNLDFLPKSSTSLSFYNAVLFAHFNPFSLFECLCLTFWQNHLVGAGPKLNLVRSENWFLHFSCLNQHIRIFWDKILFPPSEIHFGWLN